MFCPKCGATIKDGSKFCPVCGGAIKQKINVSDDVQNQSDAPTGRTAQASANSYNQNYNKSVGSANAYGNEPGDDGSGSNKRTIIIISVIAAIACIVAAVILLNGETEEEKLAREASERAESMIDGVNDIYSVASSAASSAYDGSAAGGYSFSTSVAEATTVADEIIINPFDYIVINYLGTNGSGYIELDIKDNNYGISNIYFALSGNNGFYSNGDKVKIIFDYTEYSMYHDEYSVSATSYDCVVKGLAATSSNNNSESSSGNTTSRTVPSYLKTCVSNDYFIIPDADSMYYDESTIQTFTDEQLKYARNEICAYAGRTYDSSGELGKYFSGFYWYQPIYSSSYFDDNCDAIINKYEKANLDLINAVEKERGVNQ